jgi:predicted TIM-barrel fold metal-dependent hydrolase
MGAGEERQGAGAAAHQGLRSGAAGGWDPAERIKDQKVDGVAAEVLYTTLAMPLFALDDIELQQAGFTAFNDWLAEHAAYDRKRLYPIALVSLEDVEQGGPRVGTRGERRKIIFENAVKLYRMDLHR